MRFENNPLHSFTILLLVLSSGLLAASMILLGDHKHITLTTDFYGITNLLSGSVFNLVAAAAFVVISLLSMGALLNDKLRQPLGFTLIGASLVPLIALLADSMWIESLGGFPAIGSGQGVIKYFSLLSIGILLLDTPFSNVAKKWISVTPVLIVLLWIGGMKFTLLEAQGIEALVKTSPLMSWMYSVWDLQTTSNLIGVYDLIAVAILILAVYKKQLLLPAVVMSGAVFVVTQTFLFTWNAAFSYETVLSTGGHFLIKDLWFIANLIMFWSISNEQDVKSL